MSRQDFSDYIRDPYRKELIERLGDPRGQCPEYKQCSVHGVLPRVHCEFQPRDRKQFISSLEKLLQLSDMRGWFPLRDAIRRLDHAHALKTCMMFTANFAIKGKLASEGQERKAASYDPALEFEADRIRDAINAIRKFIDKVEDAEDRRPVVPATKRFTDYKRVIYKLIACGLDAMAELCDFEKRAVSLQVLKVTNKTSFRLQIDEILPPSSTTRNDRYWEALEDLLDGIDEITRNPSPKKWNRTSPKKDGSGNGNALQQDIRKLTAADVELMRTHFDLLAPGLYKRIETDSDQVAIFTDIMSLEPVFPPLLTYILQLAFLHNDDLVQLRVAKRNHQED